MKSSLKPNKLYAIKEKTWLIFKCQADAMSMNTPAYTDSTDGRIYGGVDQPDRLAPGEMFMVVSCHRYNSDVEVDIDKQDAYVYYVVGRKVGWIYMSPTWTHKWTEEVLDDECTT